MLPSNGAVSDPHLLRAARGLRATSQALEAGVLLIVAGSIAAFGAVHPESYRWVWLGGLLLGALAAAREAFAGRLRRALGWHRIALDAGGAWRRFGDTPHQSTRWSADLRTPASRAPLLLPGACFAALALVQLAPLPLRLVGWLSPGRTALESKGAGAWLTLTVSPAETRRGLAFLAAALLVHLAAAAASGAGGARGRLLRRLSLFGLVLSIGALVQLFLATEKIYGVFAPLEGTGSVFGPFVNRNHFAGCMLMVIPAALAVAARALRSCAGEVRHERGWRRLALLLDTRAGASLIRWAMPVLATTAALLATESRGALLAFLLGLSLLAFRMRRGAVLWLVGLAAAAALSGLGLERLHDRLVRTPQESLLRTLVWKDSLERSRGFRLVGTGFNTYATALNRTEAWALPEGATAWPAGGSPTELLGPRGGYRILPGLEGGLWYREAHNDYLQVLIETGVPGLALALWAAAAALLAAREDPWVLAGLAGVLFHEMLDFDLQIPGLALLFVTLAAVPAKQGRGSPG